MTRLFTDGAEMGDLLGLSGYYEQDYLVHFTVSSTSARSGTYSYAPTSLIALNRTACGYYNIGTLSEVYFRFCFNTDNIVNTSPTFFVSSGNATPIIAVKLSNKIMHAYVNDVLVATGTHPDLEASTWHLIEGHFVMADAGTIQVKVNGLLAIDYSGDTKPGAGTTFDRAYFGVYNCEYSSIDNFYDDIAINDTAGAVDNSWCGEGHTIIRPLNANGDSSQLLGSDGNSTDNYLLVNEVPSDGDTTYVESATAGEKDLYNLTPCGLTNVTIRRVWAEARAKDTTTGDGTVKLLIKTEGTEYESADIDLSTSYAAQRDTVYAVNPNTGLPWTVAQLDALQVGMKIVD